MEIKLGRFYKTRQGQIVGPIVKNESTTYPFGAMPLGPSSTWKVNGWFYDNEIPHPCDLLEEVRPDGQPLNAKVKAIDQMTLADYRRGIERMNKKPW